MSTQKSIAPLTSTESDRNAKLRSQYGSEAIELAGPVDALYEHHFVFDDVVDPEAAGPRDRFVALARSVRDILSGQQCVSPLAGRPAPRAMLTIEGRR
jgi:starch phosphorylase